MTTLYYGPGACSLAPHIALEETGAPFDTVRVVLAEGQQLKPEYLAVNPRGRVPALVVDGKLLTEAAAILAYVARRYPEAGLLPDDPWEQGQAFSWMGFLASSVHIAFAGIWRPARFAGDAEVHPELQKTGRATVERYFAEIEERLAGREWALSRYSVVDPYLLVFYRFGLRVGLPMAERFPEWTRHAARMQERPAVQRVLAREGIAIAP
ncbi:MAG TPA: glutathione S-transferase N-terminal domain-containing protein [Azospirillaceae bacterium]|nr:glutathione S-transferase N-terminal domain-containing protein [Azospirillaceae bacterium]